MNDYYVISIESRKGGVGKTTAALNLSRLLAKRRQYAVLFLDVDITGTNIVDSLDSPFWKNYTKALFPHGNRAHEGKLNLLELFDKHFMIGKNVYEFSLEKNDKEKCTIDLNSINIIGSQIYSDENDNINGSHYCICSPSILFDELHSFWFVAFLKQMCDNFAKVVGQKDKRAVIIIDNSPGFVGISPAIHQWLTDIGPDRGKLLTVSTLDEQDLISCCYAVNTIHEQLSVKHDVALQMASILDKNSKKAATNKEIKDKIFYLRLLEEKNDKNSDLKYYLNLHNQNENKRNYLIEPSRYQNWIINRVPGVIKEGLIKNDVGRIFRRTMGSGNGKDLYDLPRKIWNQNSNLWGEFPQDNLVSYDEYIEWQFQRKVTESSERRFNQKGMQYHHNIEKLKERLFLLKRNISIVEMFSYTEERQISQQKFKELSDFVRQAQQISDEAVSLLNFLGPYYIPRLIRNKWLPEYPFKILKESFDMLIAESELPFERPFEFEIDDKIHREELYHETKQFYHQLRQYIDSYIQADANSIQKQFASFAYVVLWESGIVSFRKPFFKEMIDFFATIFFIQHNHLNLYRKKYPKASLQQFLVNAEFSEKDFHRFEEQFMEMREHVKMNNFFRKFMYREEKSGFPSFYKALCKAQARLLDLHEDIEFLFFVIQRLLKSDSKIQFLPYIRKVLEDVIEKKVITHSEGRKRCAKGFAEADYMQEFIHTLSMVARKWGMI